MNPTLTVLWTPRARVHDSDGHTLRTFGPDDLGRLKFGTSIGIYDAPHEQGLEFLAAHHCNELSRLDLEDGLYRLLRAVRDDTG